MFAAGIEDPATGSAASTLAAMLQKSVRIVQGVDMGQRSVIGVEVQVENEKVESVYLVGEAVKVMEGKITL